MHEYVNKDEPVHANEVHNNKELNYQSYNLDYVSSVDLLGHVGLIERGFKFAYWV